MAMALEELRELILETMYCMKTCDESEKSDCQRRLDAALDRACRGTVYSRGQVYTFIYTQFYPDFARRRKLRDRPKL